LTGDEVNEIDNSLTIARYFVILLQFSFLNQPTVCRRTLLEKYMKLKNKILLLYVGVSILILATIGTLLFKRLTTAIYTDIYNDFQSQLAHIDFALSSVINSAKKDLAGIVAADRVRSTYDENFTNFTDADPATFQYNIGELEQKIITIFNTYRITHDYVNSVYMGRENGGFVRSHKRAKSTKYDPRLRPWYVLGRFWAGR